MLIPEPLETTLENARLAGVISTPEKNLRSKMDSILRSLENLTQKKLRIEFEIKKQQKSLIRKRQELRRSSSTRSKKLKVALESSQIEPNSDYESRSRSIQILDSRLLQESDQALNR